MNNNFADNLKKIRKENNLSQEQLAEKLNVSRQAISKWESSIAYPEMDKIIALCQMFNLNIDDLLNKDIKELRIEDEGKKTINKSIDSFLNFITDTINLFANMTFKSKIKCIVEQLLICLVLYIISSIITGIVSSTAYSLFSYLPGAYDMIFYKIFKSIAVMFCFVSSVVILVHIFKVRYLTYYSDFIKPKEVKLETKEEKIDLKAMDNNNIIIRDPKHSDYRFISGLFKLIVAIIKFFAIWVLLFFCLTLICMLAALVLSFLIIKTGIFFIGLLIAIISASIINILIVIILLNFLFSRKNNIKMIIITFIISIVSLGIGCGLIAVGSLDFEIMQEDSPLVDTKTLVYDFDDNFFINSYQHIDYIEEDIDNIRVELKSNIYCYVIDYYSKPSGYRIYTYCDRPIALTKDFIKNLNNKKLVIPSDDIKIYANKNNLEIIKNNYKEYFNRPNYEY